MLTRIATIATIVLISFFTIIKVFPLIPENTSLSQLFPSNNKVVNEFKDFYQAFATDEFLIVAVTNEGNGSIFTPQGLTIVDQITSQMEKLEDLDMVVSITNLEDFNVKKIPFTKATFIPLPGGLFVAKPYDQLTKKRITELSQNPFFLTGMISPDAKTTIIWLLLDPELKLQTNFIYKIENIVKTIPQQIPKSYSVRVSGFPLLHSTTYQLLMRDGVVFFGLSLLISAMVFLILRIPWYAFTSLVLSIFPITAIWFVYLYLAGKSLHLFSNMVLPFFFIVTVPSLVHLSKAIYRQKK